MMTPEEAKEYQSYLLAQGFTPEEAKEYMQEFGLVPSEPEKGILDYAKQGGLVALDAAGRVLDYAGGLTRTALAEGADIFTDGNVVTADDWSRALAGRAPDSSEYLERFGAGTMGSVNIPFLGEVAGRDVLGFGLDVAADPTTYLTFGAAPIARAATKGGIKGTVAKGLQKAEKALSKPGDLVAGAGKKMYKSGLKRVDQEAAKYGKEPVSDLLLEHRVAGSAGEIQRQMDELADKFLAERDAILKEATEKGARVSMAEAMEPAERFVKAIREGRDPKLQPLADRMEAEIAKYKALEQAAYTPVERVAPRTEVIDLPTQGAEFTPVRRVEPKVETIELPTQGSAVSYTPIETLPARTTEIELPVPSRGQFNQSTLVFEQVPQPSMPGIIRESPRVVRGGPDVEEFIQASSGPLHIRTPARFERAGRTEFIPSSTGPYHYIEPGGWRKAAPTVEERFVTPIEASGYKTTAGALIPDSEFRSYAISSAATKGNKILAGGLKEATEKSVGRKLGAKAQERLSKANDALGRILTTREKQALEAAKEANKNAVTSVDAMILGTGQAIGSGPKGLAVLGLKKAADVAKTAAPRTRGGLLLHDLGTGRIAPITNAVIRRSYIEQMDDELPPWYFMSP